jgi:hypothetical protein
VPRLSKGEWRKTPYAGTRTERPDEAIRSLLENYGVKDYQWMQSATGANGRAAIALRFLLKGKSYRFVMECLDVPEVAVELLILQIKRALYWQLKTALEGASVFFPADMVLYAWRELPDGRTLHEATAPALKSLTAKGGSMSPENVLLAYSVDPKGPPAGAPQLPGPAGQEAKP